MSSKLGPDVFSHILAHIWDTKSLYSLSKALPVKHALFWPVVKRIMDFPVYICTEGEFPCKSDFPEDDDLVDEPLPTSAPNNLQNTLTILLGQQGEPIHANVKKLRDAIRYITLCGSGSEGGIPLFEDDHGPKKEVIALLKATKGLRALSCENDILPNKEAICRLGSHLPNLKTLMGDCIIPGYLDGGWGWQGDSLEPLAESFGNQLSYLHLERVSIGQWSSLEEQTEDLSRLSACSRIYLDLTEGPWNEEDYDWNYLDIDGSMEDWVFKSLGFPALKHVKTRIIDHLLSQERIGIMEFADWEQVQDLSLTVQRSYDGYAPFYRNIRVFHFLRPQQFSALKTLEIHDIRRTKEHWRWSEEQGAAQVRTQNELEIYYQSSRCYWGLVPNFLAGVKSGDGLQNLTSLWVNQQVLCMPKGNFVQDVNPEFYTTQQLWERNNDEEENQRKEQWVGVLRAVFEKLESLRVGFGAMTVAELGLILDLCSKDKLKQFGFQYLWSLEEKDKVLPQGIIEHLARFHNLSEVHILHPRPGTEETYTLSPPSKNLSTFQDVNAIFNAIPSVCYVGVGNAVWERNCVPHSDELGDTRLAWSMYTDPRQLAIDSVPRFFQIPHVQTWTEISSTFCTRGSPMIEVERFKRLLRRLQQSPDL